MAIDFGAIGSIGSTFLGDLATIREGSAIAGSAKISAAGARRAADFTQRQGDIDVIRQKRGLAFQRQDTSRQLGGIVADASGAGLTQDGSSQDILCEATTRGAIDVGLTKMNISLTQEATGEAVQTFLDRAAGFDAQAKAAKKKKKGGILGAIGGVIGGVGGFLIGGPAGAAAGASLGSGIGQGIGSL